MCHDYLPDNLVHRDARVILAMSDGALVLLLALELEHQRFFAAPMRDDRTLDAGVLRIGARLDRLAVNHGKHTAELDLGADLAIERLDLDRFARRDAILFPARFYNCVHTGIP